MSKSFLRIISDVHGHYDEYIKLTEETEYSISQRV